MRSNKLTFRCNDELKRKIDMLVEEKSTTMSALLLEYVVQGVRNDMAIKNATSADNLIKLLKEMGINEELIKSKLLSR